MKPIQWAAGTGKALFGAVLGSLAIATTAAAAPSPPFTQCPPVGPDASCGTLIVVNADGRLEALNDPRVPPIGTEDALIGVQNDSSAPVESISIVSPSAQIYRFDGNGICSERYAGALAGCPFGHTGYEGPGTEFVITEDIWTAEGSVRFTGAGLLPGASTYFDIEGISLEGLTELACGTESEHEGCHTLAPTFLSTTLSGGGQSRPRIVVPQGTAVTDRATLSGADASEAGGTIEYDVYSDPECRDPVTSAGSATVVAGAIPASDVETFPPGTYYWRATYSGDTLNAGSQSPCASLLVFPRRECTSAGGGGHLGPRGPGRLTESNRLDVSGSPHKLTVRAPGIRLRLQALTSAACLGWHEFRGAGPATVDGAEGYFTSFAIDATEEGVFLTVSVEKEGVVIFEVDHEKLDKSARERFKSHRRI